MEGWREALAIICLAYSCGVLSTYVAIYAKQELGMPTGSGLFFTFLATGLILSRLTGARALRKNKISRNASLGLVVSVAGYFLFAFVHNPVAYCIAPFVIGLGNGHMYPAFQNMFINLAPNNKRGTANSSLLTSWDLGVGFGVLAGGAIAEHLGYQLAFWTAFVINVVGVAWYFLKVRGHFERNKLR